MRKDDDTSPASKFQYSSGYCCTPGLTMLTLANKGGYCILVIKVKGCYLLSLRISKHTIFCFECQTFFFTWLSSKLINKDIIIYVIKGNLQKILRLICQCRKCDTILNHTGLYEYKHGKMLMHLKFCFESIPNEPTPAAMLRYYRQRKRLTTRQLAENVGIVPATVLMYERGRFPIPYQIAVAFADILEIDSNLLFDEFARFMDYPYSNRLREVRKVYGLNQTVFAEKANICYSIYAKWETAVRQPSRKMYEQLVTTYPEIKI